MTALEKTLQIGDIVIFTDQSKNLIENTLLGGKVALIQDTKILILGRDNIYRMYKIDEVRALTTEDFKNDQITII